MAEGEIVIEPRHEANKHKPERGAEHREENAAHRPTPQPALDPIPTAELSGIIAAVRKISNE